MLKLTKSIIFSVIFCLFLSSAFAQEQSQKAPRIIQTYPDLEMDVWTDKGEGAVYNPGEEIEVFFQTSEDCYVLIYNIDTRGYVNILYPYDYSDRQWVSGERIYRIPGRYDDYQLRVDGPEGTEYIQAICSTQPINLPNWPRYMGGFRGEDEEVSVLRLDEDEDPYDFIQFTNEWMVQNGDFATDLCIFTVEYPHPRWYYWPRTYYTERPWHYELGACYIWYPYGAEVYIDGVFYGIAPITLPYLIVGRHFVTIYFCGCRVFWDWVWVYPERTVWVRPHHIYDRYRFVHDDPIRKEYRKRKDKSYTLKEEKPSRRGRTAEVKSERSIEKEKKTRLYTKEKTKVKKRTYTRDSSIRQKDDFKLKSKKGEQKVFKKTIKSKVEKESKRKFSSAKKSENKEKRTIKSVERQRSKSKSFRKENVSVKKTRKKR